MYKFHKEVDSRFYCSYICTETILVVRYDESCFFMVFFRKQFEWLIEQNRTRKPRNSWYLLISDPYMRAPFLPFPIDTINSVRFFLSSVVVVVMLSLKNSFFDFPSWYIYIIDWIHSCTHTHKKQICFYQIPVAVVINSIPGSRRRRNVYDGREHNSCCLKKCFTVTTFAERVRLFQYVPSLYILFPQCASCTFRIEKMMVILVIV